MDICQQICRIVDVYLPFCQKFNQFHIFRKTGLLFFMCCTPLVQYTEYYVLFIYSTSLQCFSLFYLRIRSTKDLNNRKSCSCRSRAYYTLLLLPAASITFLLPIIQKCITACLRWPVSCERSTSTAPHIHTQGVAPKSPVPTSQTPFRVRLSHLCIVCTFLHNDLT